jgi:UDP-N-acetyl-D-galactosamine dehydrogenase
LSFFTRYRFPLILSPWFDPKGRIVVNGYGIYMKTYAIIGLGYVGLGLAASLSKKNTVFGYDINESRVLELRKHIDRNQQIDQKELDDADIYYTCDLEDIKQANFYIVTVSTPAYFYETPNLEPLIDATKTLASVIKKGDIIVYESTVYPGTTEDICIPILEKISHLRCGLDFNVGYSPERINPGDKKYCLKNITKIISAQNKETLKAIQETYETICNTIYPVSSIPTAEAVKILENTQRDVNIAFMNEFTKIMHALKLDTHEIIEGAKTKFSFVPFKPGFVGGHCISIDPHYLAFEAKRHGVQPELILAARRVNDGMPQFVIQSMMKILLKNQIDTSDLTIGVFGVSYKENVLDTRNSLAFKLIKELKEYGLHCRVHDPLIHNPTEKLHGVHLEHFDEMNNLSVAVIVVGHDFYRTNLKEILFKCKKPAILMDIPNLFINETKQLKKLIYWNL